MYLYQGLPTSYCISPFKLHHIFRLQAVWLVTGRLLVQARHLTLTAPNELAVSLCGRRRRRCVNVGMNG